MDLRSSFASMVVAASLSLGSGSAAQTPNCIDLSTLDPSLQQMLAAGTVGVPGATMSLTRNGKVVHETDLGGVDRNTVFRIASASKWIAGAIICSLAEDGILDIDTPVVRFLPGFTGSKSTITVRHLFTHTSGLVPDHPAITSPSLTLAQASDLIATTQLVFTPGSAFQYGNVGMHVGARVAEIASGQDWLTLFQDRIAGPLNLVATDYGGLANPTNPLIAAGMRSTREEYQRFLQMLADGGIYNGQVVLGPAAMELLLSDQTGDLIPTLPGNSPGSGSAYGIGCFVDRYNEDGQPVEFSSPGAFGADPWIDLERKSTGLILIESLRPVTRPFADQIRRESRDLLPYRGVECLGNGNTSCLGPMNIHVDLIPQTGLLTLPVVATNAPPMSFGTALIGSSSYTNPLEILSAQILVTLGRNTTGVPAFADANGRSKFAVPFGLARPGDRFILQFVFPESATCGTAGQWASTDGIEITTQR